MKFYKKNSHPILLFYSLRYFCFYRIIISFITNNNSAYNKGKTYLVVTISEHRFKNVENFFNITCAWKLFSISILETVWFQIYIAAVANMNTELSLILIIWWIFIDEAILIDKLNAKMYVEIPYSKICSVYLFNEYLFIFVIFW